MPDLRTTKRLVETFVTNNVTTIPLSYDNIEYLGNKDFYVHLTLSFLLSSNANIGSQLHKRVRHQGDIVFKLFTQIGIGSDSAFEALDYIRTQVENKQIDSNLFTYAAQPTRQGVGDEGSYTYFLRIPFVSDE